MKRCRPLKRPRFSQLPLSHNLRCGLVSAIAARLEYGSAGMPVEGAASLRRADEGVRPHVSIGAASGEEAPRTVVSDITTWSIYPHVTHGETGETPVAPQAVVSCHHN